MTIKAIAQFFVSPGFAAAYGTLQEQTTDPLRLAEIRLEFVAQCVALTRSAIAYQRRHRLELPGYVYFSETPHGCIKIGYSDNPVRRLWEHHGRGLDLRPLLVVPASPDLERELHRRFVPADGPAWEIFQNRVSLWAFIRWLREGLAE